MSTEQRKYLLYSVMDFLFTFGGTAAVILYNYLVPDSTMGYKLSLTGIILFVAVLFMAKYMFEKHYREKLDTMLKQLAEATDPSVKQVIGAEIEKHKIKNTIYERLMLLLPLIVLVFITTVAMRWLEDLRASAGLILLSMGIGSVFNVIKKPVSEKVKTGKYRKKAAK